MKQFLEINSNCDSNLWPNLQFDYNLVTYQSHRYQPYVCICIYMLSYDRYLVYSGFREQLYDKTFVSRYQLLTITNSIAIYH